MVQEMFDYVIASDENILSDEGPTQIIVFKDNGFTFRLKAVGSHKLELKLIIKMR